MNDSIDIFVIKILLTSLIAILLTACMNGPEVMPKVTDKPYYATKEDGCGAPINGNGLFHSYYWPAECYVEGELNVAHYETFKKYQYSQAKNACVLFTNELIERFEALGYEPQTVLFYPGNNINFTPNVDHAAVYLDGLVYDNGAVTKGRYYEAFPVDELLHQGKYTILPYGILLPD